MEAVAYLGRTAEARAGIEYLLSFQRDDGGFMLIDKHYKETGIVLWAVTRHAQLTGDREWLAKVWPRLERGWNYIRQLRKDASADPAAPNAGLIPVGFSDGGLSGPHAEYTNIYWTLAGMRAAVDAARWLGRQEQAAEWQRDYDDFYAAFRRAAARDMRKDAHGNPYLPISMTGYGGPTPQRAQWAFLHAVFPGKVFAADDELVRGNMTMLQACEVEGLVLDTGWLKNGLWNYFGSFYAHAWLWTGRPEKAIETLYAFGNHASPLLAWREEHRPQGKGAGNVGDMPHNWASAEFIRLVRHLLVLERGSELHLLEGLPASWVAPGAVTRLADIETAFGPMSLEVAAAADGRSVHIRLTPPSRTPPAKIIMHLGTWAGRQGTLDLPTSGPVDREVPLGTPSP
jgi:GH15 family glucan-1,4-alpha-glucosidase